MWSAPEQHVGERNEALHEIKAPLHEHARAEDRSKVEIEHRMVDANFAYLVNHENRDNFVHLLIKGVMQEWRLNHDLFCLLLRLNRHDFISEGLICCLLFRRLCNSNLLLDHERQKEEDANVWPPQFQVLHRDSECVRALPAAEAVRVEVCELFLVS